mgnify:CR=1 FL=1
MTDPGSNTPHPGVSDDAMRQRFEAAALSLCAAAAGAEIEGNGADLVLSFGTQAKAKAMWAALVVLEGARLDLAERASNPSLDSRSPFIGVSATTLDAIPTKPLDVEVRQWALERVERMQAYRRMDVAMVFGIAELFVRYAMTGAVPTDQPEDAA